MNEETIDIASKELWECAKSIYFASIKNEEEKDRAERYLSMITSVSQKDNVFTIFASTNFAVDFITKEYLNKLKGSFLVAGAENIAMEVKLDANKKSSLIVPQEMHETRYAFDEPRVSEFKSTIPLNDEYTFEEFVSGPSNSFAIAAARAVVTNPGRSGYNPLFIHGGTGLGKTHLMQAIGNELKKKNPSLSICYLTAEEYMNEYINHLKDQSLNEFRNKYRRVNILLLDDVQFFKKGGAVQEEFFNTFNALKEKKSQIVMTSDVAPKNLPDTIEERLISRFEGGMLQEIESPNYETRLAILRKKTESMDIRFPDSALEFIADNIKSHVRAMEGALATLEVFMRANATTVIDNNVLNDILADFIKKEATLKLLTIKEIQLACAKKYNITMDDILSHERTQTLVTPRQMAMYISKKYTSKGLKEIAEAFDKKHATIINGVKTIQQRMSNEPDLKANLEDILSSFGYRLSDSME